MAKIVLNSGDPTLCKPARRRPYVYCKSGALHILGDNLFLASDFFLPDNPSYEADPIVNAAKIAAAAKFIHIIRCRELWLYALQPLVPPCTRPATEKKVITVNATQGWSESSNMSYTWLIIYDRPQT